MCISPTDSVALQNYSTSRIQYVFSFPPVITITYSHSLNLYTNSTGVVMDCYYLPGTLMMCPNPWMNNTLHHILFIISDAERAAITAWSLPFTALTTEPCMAHSIYYLRMKSTNGLLPKTECGSHESLPTLTQMNLNLQNAVVFYILPKLM